MTSIEFRRHRVWALLGLGLAMGGCRGCDNESLRFVPASAHVLVTTPRLSRAASQLGELLEGLNRAGLSPTHGVARTLGVIRQTSRELERYGLDGSEGAAVAVLPNGEVALVFGVSHPARIAAWWRRVAEAILARPLSTHGVKHGGLQIECIQPAPGASARGRGTTLAWTLVGQMSLAVLVLDWDGGGQSPESRAVASVVGLAKLDQHVAMAQSDALRRSLAGITGRSALAGFIDVRAMWERRGERLRAASADASPELRALIEGRQRMVVGLLGDVDGLGLALQSSATGIALRVRALGGAGAAGRGKERSPWGVEGKATKLDGFLEPASLVLGRASVDLAALLDSTVRHLPTRLRRSVYGQMGQLKRHHGIDLEGALQLLSNRFALGISLVDRLGPRPEGQRDEGPVDAAFVAVAQTRDGPAVDELLARLERALVLRGLEVRVHETGADTSPRYAAWGQGGCEVARWGREGDALVLRLAAWGCLPEPLRAAPGGSSSRLDLDAAIRVPRARQVFAQNSGAVIYLDVARAMGTLGGWFRDVPTVGAVGWPLALLVDDLALTVDADGRDLVGEIVLRLGTERTERASPR